MTIKGVNKRFYCNISLNAPIYFMPPIVFKQFLDLLSICFAGTITQKGLSPGNPKKAMFISLVRRQSGKVLLKDMNRI